MKRKMKFRAWDKRKKEWVSVGFHILGETTLFGLIEIYCLENKGYGESSLERMNDIEVTEFTGLKERNGRDIYEGDIIKHPICEIGTVIFFQPYAQFAVEKGEFLYDITYHNECEKIGNIYENSYLL